MTPIFGAKKHVFGILTLLKRSDVLGRFIFAPKIHLKKSFDFLPLFNFLGRDHIFLGQKTVFQVFTQYSSPQTQSNDHIYSKDTSKRCLSIFDIAKIFRSRVGDFGVKKYVFWYFHCNNVVEMYFWSITMQPDPQRLCFWNKNKKAPLSM